MFSKLRNGKSGKTTERPKLRGMPALKQMRSSKREECLSMKTGAVLSTLSELKKKTVAKGKEAVHPTLEELERHGSKHVVITPNYKRSVSPDSGQYSHANHVDRISCSNGSNFVFYGEVTLGVGTEDIPEADEDLPEDRTNINSPWRISNGDSGYKSKDDGKMDSKNIKVKKTRKKTNGTPSAAGGLHQIKQERKASREIMSQSMRALTPKERESIQCLEDVLKDHPDGNESFDEVFNSESSDHEFENEADMIFIEANKSVEEEVDETMDYGYASVNDISRKYSLDSLESVGSIIDLVGNLSTSPSSQISPIYSVVDMSKKKRDSTRDNDAIETANNDVIVMQYPDERREVKFLYEEEVGARHGLSDDVIVHPEDVITQLDDVINSFNVQTDEEAENIQNGRECHNERTNDMRSMRQILRESVTDDDKAMRSRERRHKRDQTDEEISDGKEETDCRSDRKKKKKEKRHKTRGHATDEESERKRRERRQGRDPEAEKERKERKKQRKEEKRKKRKEISESTDAAKRREENIARHVDEISALTQTMIKAGENEEPVYAQVRKPKKYINGKDINGNLKLDDIELEEMIPDPPLQFANPPTVKQIELEKEQQRASQTPEREDSFSKFHLTSTPIEPTTRQEMGNNSMQEEDVIRARYEVPVPTGPRRPVSDSSQYTNAIEPYFSKFQQPSDCLHVSQAMLEDSSHNLKHVTQHGPKVLQVDPYRYSLKETNYKSTPPSKVCNETPIVDPEMFMDSSKLQQNAYRHPVPTRQNFRTGRPVSLNLEGSLLGEKKKVAAVKPYSSFREEKSNPKPAQKPRPFVIRTMKKPIQLY